MEKKDNCRTIINQVIKEHKQYSSNVQWLKEKAAKQLFLFNAF